MPNLELHQLRLQVREPDCVYDGSGSESAPSTPLLPAIYISVCTLMLNCPYIPEIALLTLLWVSV